MLVDGSCKHVGGLSKEPNYNSLSTFVGRLKKAAIDAYMRSLGFNLVDGYYALQVHMDSDYGVPDSQKYQYIVPPDEAGSNGGENRNVYVHSRFVDEFETFVNLLTVSWRCGLGSRTLMVSMSAFQRIKTRSEKSAVMTTVRSIRTVTALALAEVSSKYLMVFLRALSESIFRGWFTVRLQ